MHRPALSVVIPCYNEAPCLELLHARVSAAARAAVGEDHEILLINDGSRDDSWAVMQGLAARDPRQARVVELRYLGGLSEQETAEVLTVSRATVTRDFLVARAWLFRRMTLGVTEVPGE